MSVASLTVNTSFASCTRAIIFLRNDKTQSAKEYCSTKPRIIFKAIEFEAHLEVNLETL